MKPSTKVAVAALLLLSCGAWAQQSPEVKFIADTLVVQAEGRYETNPDLATMSFKVSAQEKELKQAYSKASQAMQNIVGVAQRNGLSPDAIETGVLTVTPFYEGDRKRRTRAYLVQGNIALKVKDFSKVGVILDDSIQDGIVDFRSLRYSLANEESAKKLAVADAMQRAVGRATVALGETRQRLGPARSVSLEVRNLVGVALIEGLPFYSEAEEPEGGGGKGIFTARRAAAPPPPPVSPEKITITASVQCVFQIEKQP